MCFPSFLIISVLLFFVVVIAFLRNVSVVWVSFITFIVCLLFNVHHRMEMSLREKHDWKSDHIIRRIANDRIVKRARTTDMTVNYGIVRWPTWLIIVDFPSPPASWHRYCYEMRWCTDIFRQFGANDWLLQHRSYRRRLNESIVEEEITMHNFPSFTYLPAFRCSSLQSTQCFGSVSVIAEKVKYQPNGMSQSCCVVNVWHHTNWGWLLAH